MKRNFFEIAKKTVQQELENSGSSYMLPESDADLKSLCEGVSRILDVYECKSASASVVDDVIVMSIVTNALILEYHKDRTFFDVIAQADGFSFSKHRTGRIQIDIIKKGCLVPYGQ